MQRIDEANQDLLVKIHKKEDEIQRWVLGFHVESTQSRGWDGKEETKLNFPGCSRHLNLVQQRFSFILWHFSTAQTWTTASFKEIPKKLGDIYLSRKNIEVFDLGIRGILLFLPWKWFWVKESRKEGFPTWDSYLWSQRYPWNWSMCFISSETEFLTVRACVVQVGKWDHSDQRPGRGWGVGDGEQHHDGKGKSLAGGGRRNCQTGKQEAGKCYLTGYIHHPVSHQPSDKSCSVMSDSFWLHELQHTRLPCPSLSPGVCSNSCPLSWWCHATITSSVAPYSPCP